MTPAARQRLRIAAPVLALSAGAWVVLALQQGPDSPLFCLPWVARGVPSSGRLWFALSLNPPSALAVGWAIMLLAMMTPLLIAPVRHVHDRSFAARRPRAILLFVTGYLCVWMAAGLVLSAFSLAFRAAFSLSFIPLAATSAVALVWQASPAKQYCLNRCHGRVALAAFGGEADLDVLRFAMAHAVWCVGACWALMLAALMVHTGHLVAMGAIALWLAAERLERPTPPAWRLRWPKKAFRIVTEAARTWVADSRGF